VMADVAASCLWLNSCQPVALLQGLRLRTTQLLWLAAFWAIIVMITQILTYRALVYTYIRDKSQDQQFPQPCSYVVGAG